MNSPNRQRRWFRAVAVWLAAALVAPMAAIPAAAQDQIHVDDVGVDSAQDQFATQGEMLAAQEAKTMIKAFDAAVKSGDPARIQKTAWEIRTNPTAIQRLNKSGNVALINAHSQVVGQTIAATENLSKQGIADAYNRQHGLKPGDPGFAQAKDVTYAKFTNPAKPGAAPKTGWDTDLTPRVKGQDYVTPQVKEVVHKSFYEAAGGKRTFGSAPRGEAAHAANIEIMDGKAIHAYGRNAPDAVNVTHGGRPIDPQQISMAAQDKVAAELRTAAAELKRAAELRKQGDFAGAAKAEIRAANAELKAYHEGAKQYRNLVETNVKNAGGQVPAKVQEGMKIFEDVENGFKRPSEATSKLKAMGETPTTMSSKAMGQIEAANKLGSGSGPKAPATGGGPPAITAPDGTELTGSNAGKKPGGGGRITAPDGTELTGPNKGLKPGIRETITDTAGNPLSSEPATPGAEAAKGSRSAKGAGSGAKGGTGVEPVAGGKGDAELAGAARGKDLPMKGKSAPSADGAAKGQTTGVAPAAGEPPLGFRAKANAFGEKWLPVLGAILSGYTGGAAAGDEAEAAEAAERERLGAEPGLAWKTLNKTLGLTKAVGYGIWNMFGKPVWDMGKAGYEGGKQAMDERAKEKGTSPFDYKASLPWAVLKAAAYGAMHVTGTKEIYDETHERVKANNDAYEANKTAEEMKKTIEDRKAGEKIARGRQAFEKTGLPYETPETGVKSGTLQLGDPRALKDGEAASGPLATGPKDGPGSALDNLTRARDKAHGEKSAEHAELARGQIEIAKASTRGEAETREAANKVSGAGADANETKDLNAAKSAAASRDGSLGKALGEAVVSGIEQGGKAFGDAFGGVAGAKAGESLFGGPHDRGGKGRDDGAGKSAGAPVMTGSKPDGAVVPPSVAPKAGADAPKPPPKATDDKPAVPRPPPAIKCGMCGAATPTPYELKNAGQTSQVLCKTCYDRTVKERAKPETPPAKPVVKPKPPAPSSQTCPRCGVATTTRNTPMCNSCCAIVGSDKALQDAAERDGLRRTSAESQYYGHLP